MSSRAALNLELGARRASRLNIDVGGAVLKHVPQISRQCRRLEEVNNRRHTPRTDHPANCSRRFS
jgi:hypothetical protein